jgi:hypothetical protein
MGMYVVVDIWWNNGCNMARVNTMEYDENLIFIYLLLVGILLSFEL